MEEEILRQKYITLKNQLYSINQKLRALDTSFDNLIDTSRNAILVDNEMVEGQNLSVSKYDVQKIQTEINTSLIPMINRRIR